MNLKNKLINIFFDFLVAVKAKRTEFENTNIGWTKECARAVRRVLAAFSGNSYVTALTTTALLTKFNDTNNDEIIPCIMAIRTAIEYQRITISVFEIVGAIEDKLISIASNPLDISTLEISNVFDNMSELNDCNSRSFKIGQELYKLHNACNDALNITAVVPRSFVLYSGCTEEHVKIINELGLYTGRYDGDTSTVIYYNNNDNDNIAELLQISEDCDFIIQNHDSKFTITSNNEYYIITVPKTYIKRLGKIVQYQSHRLIEAYRDVYAILHNRN